MHMTYVIGLGAEDILMSTGEGVGLGWDGVGVAPGLLQGPVFLGILVESKDAPQGWCCFILIEYFGDF